MSLGIMNSLVFTCTWICIEANLWKGLREEILLNYVGIRKQLFIRMVYAWTLGCLIYEHLVDLKWWVSHHEGTS